MKSKKYFRLFAIFCFLVLIFLLGFVFRFLGLYRIFSWLDIVLHFIGGVSIAYFFIESLRVFNKKIILRNRFFEIIIIVSLVSFAAVGFEFFEFFINFIFKPAISFQGTLEDTMSDLFFGIFGGFLMSLFRKVNI